jgi:hypothetical protein
MEHQNKIGVGLSSPLTRLDVKGEVEGEVEGEVSDR